jgi:hypothetical protein
MNKNNAELQLLGCLGLVIDYLSDLLVKLIGETYLISSISFKNLWAQLSPYLLLAI